MCFHRHEPITKIFEYIVSYSTNLTGLNTFSEIIFATDGKYGSRRRKVMFPAYKAHRKEQVKNPADIERLRVFNSEYSMLIDIFKLLGKTLNIDTIEADDFANIIVDRFKDDNQIYLLSSDLDWLSNLVNENVYQIHLNRGLIDKELCYQSFERKPEDILFIESICGIAKENVKGVYRVGEKKIIKLLNENRTHQEIIDIVQAWVDTGKFGSKLPEDFKSVQEMFDFNYEVLRKVTLEDFSDEEKEKFMEQFKHKPSKSMTDLDNLLLEYFHIPASFLFDDKMKYFFKLKE
jgi:5'-3' exonuclease